MAISTTTKINNILKREGRTERLVRGHGYYYVSGVAVSSSLMFNTLGPEDFDLAMDHVRTVLAQDNIETK